MAGDPLTFPFPGTVISALPGAGGVGQVLPPHDHRSPGSPPALRSAALTSRAAAPEEPRPPPPSPPWCRSTPSAAAPRLSKRRRRRRRRAAASHLTSTPPRAARRAAGSRSAAPGSSPWPGPLPAALTKWRRGGTGAEGGRHGRAGARGGRALLSCGPVRGVSVLLTTWCCAEKFPELGFVKS